MTDPPGKQAGSDRDLDEKTGISTRHREASSAKSPWPSELPVNGGAPPFTNPAGFLATGARSTPRPARPEELRLLLRRAVIR